MELNDMMQFDHVVKVASDGTITDAPDLYAPDMYDGELHQGEDKWTLLSGYTGQYGYNGPVMHNSEYIGGGLERDIRATPGYYVALVNYTLAEDEEPEGWGIAFLPTDTTTENGETL